MYRVVEDTEADAPWHGVLPRQAVTELAGGIGMGILDAGHRPRSGVCAAFRIPPTGRDARTFW